MIRKIKTKDINNLYTFLQARDKKADFNKAKEIVKNGTKNSHFSLVIDNEKSIDGLLVVEPKDDKFYLTLETKSKNDTRHMLQVLFWDFKKELYINIKKTNKIGFELKKLKFKIIDKNDDGYVMYYNPNWRGNRK